MKRRHFSTLLGGAATASAAWPAPSRAQPAAKSYRVGYLALLPGEDATLAKSVLERLNELGYREGQNMTFDFRSADGQSDRLPSLVMEMVRANPDVLITGFGTLTAKAAKAATTTVPIVFTSVGDPVGAGLVATLNRPGANVTGMASQASDFAGKQLQILEELVPGNQLVAVLMNRTRLLRRWRYNSFALPPIRDGIVSRSSRPGPPTRSRRRLKPPSPRARPGC
jgi:putative ABC transport system substrate-binding protein